MNKKIEIGKINILQVDRIADPGLYLVDEEGESVLLPNAYVSEDMQLDDMLEVFIYTDSEDRLIATTLKPKAMLDEFGYFEVVSVTNFGAFVDWGLPKDLFVPKALQKIPLEEGMKFVFRICLDEDTNRLVGAHKFKKYIRNDIEELEVNQRVEIIIREKTPLGYKVIVDNKYEAMIFQNEIFEDIWIGQKKIAYIKKIRPDKKLDISLQPIGKENENVAVHRLEKVLRSNGGSMPFTYKSSSEDIKEAFGLSKKNYKRALTKLLEEKIITLDENTICLNQ
ncbi:MAG: S1-like domain-containing RNA-binding protein [Sulfurospirillaceae bacterium]|nr:S1-like domain-containing RNA-binding protein [Sulfurospirillaceae bacterium]